MTIQLSQTISLFPVFPAIELQLAGFGFRVINSTFSNDIAISRLSRYFPGTAGIAFPVVPDPVGEGTTGKGKAWFPP